MTNEINLSGNIADTNTAGVTTPTPVQPKKKKSGCACCLVGCAVIIFLILLPFIGAGIYVATLDDADIGGMIISTLKYPGFAKGFNNGIQKADNITAEEKQVITAMFNQLITTYDTLSPAQQLTVKKDLWIFIKDAWKNPNDFGKNPPPEFIEFLKLIKFDENSIGTTPTSQQPQQQPTQSTGDPYNFDAPVQNNPANQPVVPSTQTPPQGQTAPNNNNQYNF